MSEPSNEHPTRKLMLRAMEREEALNSSNSPNDDDQNDEERMDSTKKRTRPGVDFSKLAMKQDHTNRPCWTCPDGTIYLEAFSRENNHLLYEQAYDFLVAIADPVARPESLHEYKLTPYSLYAAVATGIESHLILKILNRLSKNVVPETVAHFIRSCTSKYGKAKLVLQHNKLHIESTHPAVLRELLRDPAIAQARIQQLETTDTSLDTKDGFCTQAKAKEKVGDYDAFQELEDDSSSDEGSKPSQPLTDVVVSFQIDPQQIEIVKRRAIELDYPLMEEYDFRNDVINMSIPGLYLKPTAQIRHYQERSLEKVFSNGRAKSGVIVLPCGAGKTLTGVTAAQHIQKSCIVLTVNAVSVMQWKEQFQKWTNIPADRLAVFTSDRKDDMHPEGCVLLTTYTMISFSGKRTPLAEQGINEISKREWGLMIMDEVHVAPAKMFRRVIGKVKTHCRLGLSATLVREDDKICDLNFLIGPKLYEANWMDLAAQGYLANVQCVDVPCPMTGCFMKEYLRTQFERIRQQLYLLNPTKMRTAEFLVRYHEARGDRIIVFADNVRALRLYAKMLQRPLIDGSTPEKERQVVLGLFRSNEKVRTICLSRVGDVGIDLPDANVLIQVSFHFGGQRQEAQRVGRILRPKSDKTQSAGSKTDAYFYTLVSKDTKESLYADKRRGFLIDQGYTYKAVDNLWKEAEKEATKEPNYRFEQKDLEWLQEVLDLESGNNVGGPGQASGRAGGSHTSEQITPPRKMHPLFAKEQRR